MGGAGGGRDFGSGFRPCARSSPRLVFAFFPMMNTREYVGELFLARTLGRQGRTIDLLNKEQQRSTSLDRACALLASQAGGGLMG